MTKCGRRYRCWGDISGQSLPADIQVSSYTNVIVPSDQQKVMVMGVMNVATTYTYLLAQALLTKLLWKELIQTITTDIDNH